MSIKIHHGAPGSYKTSGAVMDDFLPCVKSCRVVVTNVRGLTIERIREAKYPLTLWEKHVKRIPEPYKLLFPEVPEGFEIIHLGTTGSAERKRLAEWFHWVPNGAFMLIDEAQSLFPDSWTTRDIAALDYPARTVTREEVAQKYAHIEVPLEDDFPGRRDARKFAAELFDNAPESFNEIRLNGVDAARLDWRPANWSDAWNMHRHFNWDITLTTPSIKSIRSDIRQTAEGGFKHINMALIGFKGRYSEGFHDAQDNGTPSSIITIAKKKISKQIWGLYDSTSTGVVADTSAGIQIWKDPKLLFMLGVLFVALFFALRNPAPAILGGKTASAPVPPPAASAQRAMPLPPAQGPAPGGNNVADNARRFDPAALGGHVANPAQTSPSSNESPWCVVGHYQVGSLHYVMLRRDGVTRVLKSPKSAEFDNDRVTVPVDGQLASNFTGRQRAAGIMGKI